MSKLQIVFDNGGGVTLQTSDGYAHYYQDMRLAAVDAMAFADSGSTDGWDGNDPDALINHTHDQINNGGYRVYDQDDVRDYMHVRIDEDDDNQSWQNIRDFFGNILTAR